MKEKDKVRYLLLVLGSLIVASSFTLVGFFTFRGELWYVVLGYLIFVIGYKTCWYGVHQTGGFDSLLHILKEGLNESKTCIQQEPFNYIQIIAGVYISAYGSIEFVQLINNPGAIQAVLTGTAVFGGYIIAHEGVNGVPL